MEICNKESSMLSFNEFWKPSVYPLQYTCASFCPGIIVTDRLWATANNFTGFGNITLCNEMLHILVSNHPGGVFHGCGNPVQRT